LIPSSAHGTNAASAVMAGMRVVVVACDDAGNVDVDDLKHKAVEHGDELAALMITYPSTHGVFEPAIRQICDLIHEHGGQVYLDGANLNAMLGVAKPGDFGIDVMHFNTHKTFSTPHGCGGPGGGPVAVTEALRPYLPVPQVVRRDDGSYAWDDDRPKSIGKVRSFFGQIGVLVRAYTYIRSLGCDGLLDVAETAVLNANYLAARLKDRYELPFPGPYAHEFIALPRFGDPRVQNVDVAKRLLDFGIHPPTMSWPIQHCLMIEPTETESKATLDAFIQAMLAIADEAIQDPQRLTSAPHTTPIGRMDEVGANRNLDVRWRPK
ncbi:MAG: aminomethyl-transferring glycine dehydrogenase subunit GcvPB, partial [Phycisphaerae bacterium]